MAGLSMAELFENVEVNRDPRWKVLTRLTVASLVLHLVFVWLVLYVPVFRDTFNIAAMIANTRFVEKAYTRTEISDDVQIVQLNQKFHYPAGYFTPGGQVAAEVPTQVSGLDPFAPKIISLASKDVEPEVSPSPSPEVNVSPSASPGASGSPGAAVAQASPSPSPLTPEEAQKELEKTAAQNNLPLPDENEINKQVLKDFAAYANDMKNQGKLNIDKPFEVEIEAQLDERGKLKNARVVNKAGDENLVDFFRKMVGALNDSGFLIYLQPISKDNPNATVRISVKQGEKEVLATFASEVSSPEHAASLAKVLNTALYLGAGARAGHDEEVLMKNTNATPDGKRVVVNFSMSRESVVEMIKKQLEPGA